MPWVSIAAADILAGLNNTELATYQNFRLAAGQSDPLAALIAQVTNEIRSLLRRRHTLDAGGGVPSGFVGPAGAIVVHRLLLRCNARPSDGRETARAEAEAFLQRAAAGEIGVELAATPTAEATSAPAPALRERRREFTRGAEEGI